MAATIEHPTIRHDMVRTPVSALLWWYLPGGLAFAFSALGLTLRETSAVWAIAFIWMGIGCALNAMRCHRLHCYVSAPAFFAGALAAALAGTGALQLGPFALNYIVWGTIGLVMLSFVPEMVWRKYV